METPQQSPKPGRQSLSFVAWFSLLALALIVTFWIAVSFLSGPGEAARNTVAIILAGIASAAVLTGAALFLRWAAQWRNLRRLFFVLVCLVTLIALAYGIENWRGKHAWMKHRQAGEAKGEKFALASFIPPEVPRDQNFAFTPLLVPAMDFSRTPKGLVWNDTNGLHRLEKLSATLSPEREHVEAPEVGRPEKGTFTELSKWREFYVGNTNYPQAAPSSSDTEVIMTALSGFNTEVKELGEAAATRPYSRFPIQYDEKPPWGILLPHLAKVKQLTTLMYVLSTAELDAGQNEAAFTNLLTALRLSDSMQNEPLLIDHLVRIATLNLYIQGIREGIVRHRWSDNQLRDTEERLGRINLLAEFLLAMNGERAMCTEGFDFLRQSGPSKDDLDQLGLGQGTAPFPSRLIPSGWYYQNMLTVSELHDQYTLPTVDPKLHRVYPKVSEEGSKAFERLRAGPYTIIAKMLMPALDKASRKTGRGQFTVDAARIGCALERFRMAEGKAAATLAELSPKYIPEIPNDVINGKPLTYRPGEDGSYILYSVGWNQTDDGGKIGWVSAKQSEIDATKGDWVWQMPARP